MFIYVSSSNSRVYSRRMTKTRHKKFTTPFSILHLYLSFPSCYYLYFSAFFTISDTFCLDVKKILQTKYTQNQTFSPSSKTAPTPELLIFFQKSIQPISIVLLLCAIDIVIIVICIKSISLFSQTAYILIEI